MIQKIKEEQQRPREKRQWDKDQPTVLRKRPKRPDRERHRQTSLTRAGTYICPERPTEKQMWQTVNNCWTDMRLFITLFISLSWKLEIFRRQGRKTKSKENMRTHKPGSLWEYTHFIGKDYFSFIFDFLVPSTTFNMLGRCSEKEERTTFT